MIRRFALLAALLAAALPPAASAQNLPAPEELQPQTEINAQFYVVQVLSQPSPEASWFSPAFLKQMPLPELQMRLDALHQNLGGFVSIRPIGDYYDVQFTRGRARVRVSLVKSQIDTFVVYNQISHATDQGSFRLAQIFQAVPPIPPVLFSAGFLRSYPLGDLDKLVAQYKRTYGAYRSVAIAGNETYIVQFEHGVMGARLHIDENEKIDGLAFEPIASVK
jgi:hypothetical protein